VKQIELAPAQRHVRWLAPALVVLSLVCAAVVVEILLSDTTGPFLGPWF